MLTEELKSEIRKTCDILKNGGLILYPTDTIWGIGCDATDEKAVKRIYELKQREDSKAMIVLVDDIGKIPSYADIPDIAYELLNAIVFPTTIIYPGARNLAPNLISADKTIGIRVTGEIFTKELARMFRKPIVSTSANISGSLSPASFSEISEEIKNGVDYIVGYRREDETPHKPSSVIKLGHSGQIEILRK